MSDAPVFRNNFDDLLQKPTGNTISETLSDVDVSNPFSDIVSPLSFSATGEREQNNGLNPSNPLEDIETIKSDEEKNFDDVDVSSDKGIDAASSASLGSSINDRISNSDESLNDENTVRRESHVPSRLTSLEANSSQSDLQDGAIPTFEITVEDPQKIGDAISAHIIYKVRTKTTSNTFRSNDFMVLRRYRDFLWLYNQLTFGNPGVIVPPVPEKHAIGRFQDEFVENRRQALERCLNKITSHPILYKDPDLKLFLESDTFTIDIKRKIHDEPKGVLKTLGEAVSNAAGINKFTETDEWFENRRNQLDILDSQLKALLKSVDAVIKQRKDLGHATVEFGDSMKSLASAELNKPLANNLMILGNLQQNIKELHEKQAQQDVISLLNTIDEYIRIIGSIKIAFNSRAKIYQTQQNAIHALQKKKTNYEKSKTQGRVSQDRLSMMLEIIAEHEHRVEDYNHEFEDVSKLIKAELDQFDKEKVEDFKNSVEAFLESMMKTQQEIIGLWESYLLQLELQQNPNHEDGSIMAS